MPAPVAPLPHIKKFNSGENTKNAGGAKVCTKIAEINVGRVGHVGHLSSIERKPRKKCTQKVYLCVGHVGHVGQIET